MNLIAGNLYMAGFINLIIKPFKRYFKDNFNYVYYDQYFALTNTYFAMIDASFAINSLDTIHFKFYHVSICSHY